MSAKSYRVTVKVRNANLLRAIEAAGFVPGSKFADAAGIKYIALNDLVNMAAKPVDKNGDITPTVERLCIFLGKMPNELFDAEQMSYSLESNTSDFDADKGELLAISGHASSPMIQGAIDAAIDSLSPRTAEILRLRFGIDGAEHTLQEVGEIYGISGDRVRQIEQHGLRLMRQPSRADKLKLAADYD